MIDIYFHLHLLIVVCLAVSVEQNYYQYVLKLMNSYDPSLHPNYSSSNPNPNFNPFIDYNIYFNSNYLNQILQLRCAFNSSRYESRFSKPVKAQFLHIPKTGGSSIKSFFFVHKQDMLKWCDGTAHKSFLLHESICGKIVSDTIYFTNLREPTSLAVSLFGVIRISDIKPNSLPLWTVGLEHKDNFTYWISHPEVIETLQKKSLLYLNVSKNDLNLMNFEPVLNRIDIERFLNSTIHAPSDLRCHDHLMAALLLIKRFSVVGSLDHLELFWKLIFRRYD
jgi:hypothetical protein